MSKFIVPTSDDWVLGIKRVGNGYVIQMANGADEEGHIKIEEYVVQEKDSVEDSEMEATCDLLYKVLECFGPNYSHHRKKNIIIKIEEEKEEIL
jgi:hypothetical protein